jgi:hypothetical protein
LAAGGGRRKNQTCARGDDSSDDSDVRRARVLDDLRGKLRIVTGCEAVGKQNKVVLLTVARFAGKLETVCVGERHAKKFRLPLFFSQCRS